MKIVFMGTPEFAVPALRALIDEGHEITYVITQPDRPKGRGNKVVFSPVKEEAVKYNIEVKQPLKLRNDVECINKIKESHPDLIVVVAFGQILPKIVLDIPKFGCINVHASLLPELRGAAPINWAVIRGNKTTGITTMFMDEGVDTGDMLLKAETKIGEGETAGELHDRLMGIGAEVLVKTVKLIENGGLKRYPQDSSRFTYAPMLNKDMGKIDWNKPSQDIKNLVRGLQPYPGAYTFIDGTKLRLWKVEVEDVLSSSSNHSAGEIFKVDKEGLHVYTIDGGIIIKELQGESGKRVDAFAYSLGHRIECGTILG